MLWSLSQPGDMHPAICFHVGVHVTRMAGHGEAERRAQAFNSKYLDKAALPEL